MAQQKTPTSISIDPDFWYNIGIICAQRKMGKSEAVEAGLRLWLAQENIQLPERPRKLDANTRRHQAAHDLLDAILESGDKKVVEWITGNLKVFAEALRGRKQPTKAKLGT